MVTWWDKTKINNLPISWEWPTYGTGGLKNELTCWRSSLHWCQVVLVLRHVHEISSLYSFHTHFHPLYYPWATWTGGRMPVPHVVLPRPHVQHQAEQVSLQGKGTTPLLCCFTIISSAGSEIHDVTSFSLLRITNTTLVHVCSKFVFEEGSTCKNCLKVRVVHIYSQWFDSNGLLTFVAFIPVYLFSLGHISIS